MTYRLNQEAEFCSQLYNIYINRNMNLQLIIISIFFILMALVESCLAGRDFYKILGVTKQSTEYEIKRSFRRLAMEMHPDKNIDNKDAAEKFTELREAFEVLSDPEKRKLYNEGGEEKVNKMTKGNQGGGGGMDPFASFFGDFFGFGGQQEHDKETPRGADVTVDLWVTYEELYVGKFVELQRIKSVYKPASGTRKCNCRQEMITRQLSPGRFQMMQQSVCDECPNKELSTQEKILEVEIEPGMKEGAEQKFHGEGEPHIDGDFGDLKVRIRTQPNAIFERRGDDLYTNATISLAEALTGFTLTLKHLDGHLVKITRDKVTWPGARIRKLNEGMPNYENNLQKGILYITFDVDFPRGEISNEDKDAFKKILANYETLIDQASKGGDSSSNSVDTSSQTSSSNKFYNGLRGY